MSDNVRPPSFLTRDYLARAGGWPVLKEAETLLAAGRVSEARYEEPFVSATVRTANGTIATRWRCEPQLSRIETHCPCIQARRDGRICAHVIAAALMLLTPPAPSARPAPATVPTTARGNPTPSTPKPIEMPSPPSRPSRFFLPAEETEAGLPVLRPRFLLPTDLAAAWQQPRLRVIIEAVEPDGATRPLDAWLRAHAGASVAVVEEAIAAMRLLESQHGSGEMPSIVALTQGEMSHLLDALIGTDEVWLGKKQRVRLVEREQSLVLNLSTDNTGTLEVSLDKTSLPQGHLLVAPNGVWGWSGAVLERLSCQHPALAALLRAPVTLSRAQIPLFFERELPALEQLARITRCERTRGIQLDRNGWQLVLELDGTPQALSCRARLLGQGQECVITPSPLRGDWRAVPSDPLRYECLDRELERRARRLLEQAGFVAGTKQPEFYTLSGEARVWAFLSNDFPRWKSEAQLVLGTRLNSLIKQCDWVQPEVVIESSGEEWLSVEVRAASDQRGGTVLSAGELQQLLQRGSSHLKTKAGRYALVATQELEEWQEVLQDCDAQAGLGRNRVSARYSEYLRAALPARWQGVETGAVPEVGALDARWAGILRPYQADGVRWMLGLWLRRCSALLADEMGLGKTLQTLCTVTELRRRMEQRDGSMPPPALVVCPTSLLANWQTEATRFAPELRVMVHHGNSRKQDLKRDGLEGVDLLITSYAVLRLDVEELCAHKFAAIVLDEAQHIKNRASQSAQAAKRLEGEFRILLTGTPVENGLLDLWSMFDFLLPGYLGTAASFKTRYEQPIVKGNDLAAQARLKRRLQPFLLRRTKAQVAKELPERLEQVLVVELSTEQRAVYQELLDQGRREVFGAGAAASAGQRAMTMLTVLTRLRQAACHLALLPALAERTWKEPSAKMEALGEMLEEIVDGGHRVLIFSQFTKHLKLVAEFMQQLGLRYGYLDGSSNDRAEQVQRFQSDAGITAFLISLKAGGTGLNLTGADTVVLLDPWWNPAVEAQAAARAHRIGQERQVTVIKLIARGTVEEKMLTLQERKSRLFAEAVNSDESFVNSLTPEEWEELLVA